MKIGISAYSLAGQRTGIGNYLYRTIEYLEKIDQENEYFLYTFHKINLPFASNSRWHIRYTKGILNVSGTFWKMVNAKAVLAKDAIDVFWAPDTILPLDLPPSIRLVSTLQDLVWRHYPETLRWDNKIILPLFCRRSLQKAARVIVASETVRNEAKDLLGSAGCKMVTIPHGGPDRMSSGKIDAGKTTKEKVSKAFGINGDYILTVGTVEPRKNMVNLLRAYSILLKRNNGSCHTLVIAGGRGWKNSRVFRTCKELGLSGENVVFLGYVPSEEGLSLLYSGAEVFVFPSFYEGFGLPSLEAMACGAPVIASDIPVFREILGDAAFFVDPRDPEKIAEGMGCLLNNRALAEDLKKMGYERARIFSWERTARETLKVLSEK